MTVTSNAVLDQMPRELGTIQDALRLICHQWHDHAGHIEGTADACTIIDQQIEYLQGVIEAICLAQMKDCTRGIVNELRCIHDALALVYAQLSEQADIEEIGVAYTVLDQQLCHVRSLIESIGQ